MVNTLKIGMMSAWNTDSGTAIHAEAIGRAWINAGHSLTVFSHLKDDYHGTGFTGVDEDYVVRCLGTQKTGFLDKEPILSSSFDLFVVQDLRMLPVKNLYKLLPEIRPGPKLAGILYENHLPDEKWFFEANWDAVVYFDRRQEFFKTAYPQAKYIPFPCFPVRQGDRTEARKKLQLPENKNIIYLFCQRGYQPVITELPDGLKENSILLIVTQTGHSGICIRDNNRIIIREEEVLSKEIFDDYLFASDICILHKMSTGNLAVVSSTAFQALGAGCPIMAPSRSDFFKAFEDVLIKYTGTADLNKKLSGFIGNRNRLERYRKNAGEFLNKNSPENISNMILSAV